MGTSVSTSYCLTGSLAGEPVCFELTPGPNRIGRDPANQIVLDSPEVSRIHAVVSVEPRRVRLLDRGSRNGTFVDRRRVREAELAAGSRVGFGPVPFRLEELGSSDEALAITVATAPPRAGRLQVEPTPLGTTRQLQRPHELNSSIWLRALLRFCDQLGGAEGGGLSRALAGLGEVLAADGVALIEFDGEARPGVLGQSGSIDGDCLTALCERWQERLRRGPQPERLFNSTRAGTGIWDPPSGSSSGLFVSGDYPHRRQSRLLLEAVLAVYVRIRGRAEPRVAGARKHDLRKLRFPEGFVEGASEAWSRLCQDMRTAATSDLPVLILGETGVGKELIARTLHSSSGCREAPFVAVNCAAIPADLLEAELFGIGAGVATGVAARKGHFERADGGTLFLDEIGEMPCALQAKLLRVLQERQLQPLGRKPAKVDVHILAATNAEIESLLEQGKFRRDLYYRLAGFELQVPPLRERPEDIPALVEAFLTRACREAGKSVRGLTVGALRRLCSYPWPGNVRELELEIRRLAHRCLHGQVITSARLSRPMARAEVEASRPDTALPTLNLCDLEAHAIRIAMQETGGSHGKAAELLGISRFSLRRRLAAHGLARSLAAP